jgi:sugar phosphate permease
VVTLRRRERELARANLALDAANFFLADVRDALGPFLAVYLLTEREWDAASIGLVMSIATIAGIPAQLRRARWWMRPRPNAA